MKSWNIFQFTPLREGRLEGACFGRCHRHFNSRPSARGDVQRRRPGAGDDLFQFTPLREGRQAPTPQLGGITIFQFTPLREGRRGRHRPRLEGRQYFNSRPSARGDRGCGHGDGCRCISIHAPPRGATEDTVQPFKIDEFQFTPLREGRRPRPDNQFFFLDFNSRPSARGDSSVMLSVMPVSSFQFTPLREGRREVADIRHRNRDISIHAPPRGATPA